MDYKVQYERLLAENKTMKVQLDLMHDLVEGDYYAIGDEFFDDAVRGIAKAVKADNVFIGKLDTPNSIKTISHYSNSCYSPNITYDLIDTPCNETLSKKACVYPCDVSGLFPEDKMLIEMGIEGYCGVPLFNSKKEALGILVALFKRKISDPELVKGILLVHGFKIGSELEHQINNNLLIKSQESIQIRNVELHQKEQELQLIFDSSPAMMMLINEKSEVLKANKQASLLSKVSKLEGQKIKPGEMLNCRNAVSHNEGCGHDGEVCEKCIIRQTIENTIVKQSSNIKVEADLEIDDGGASQTKHLLLSTNTINLDESKKFLVAIDDITERKRFEQNLQASEKRLKLFFNQSPLGIIEWGENAEILAMNAAAEKIFGYNIEELHGQQGIEKLVAEELRPDIKKVWKKTLNLGHQHSINKNVTKSGKEIICEWNNTTIVDFDNKSIGFISIVEDVTEKEKVRKKLKLSEERHKLISKISTDYIYASTIQGDKIQVDWSSGGFSRISGYEPEEIQKIDGNWFGLVHPDDKQQYKDTFGEFNVPYARKLDYRIKSKKGETRWISSNNIPLLGEKGKIKGYLGSLTDITDQKRSELSLRQSEERFRILFEKSADGIILINKDLVIIDCNSSILNILGFDFKDEMVGKNIADISFSHQHDGKNAGFAAREHVNECLENERTRFEWIHIKKSGDPIWIDVMLTKISYNNEVLVHALLRNITKIREYQSELQEKDRELSRNAEYLEQAQKVAQIGNWNWNLIDKKLFHSDEIKNIFEVEHNLKNIDFIFNNHIYHVDKAEVYEAWKNIAKNDNKFDIEFRIVVKNKLKWVNVVAERKFNQHAEPVSIVGMAFDTTARKIVELKNREQDLQLIELNKQIANYKMMALRSVMNPHFIFNCLNSIQFFIAKNEKKPAISYLSLFSKLMRNVLNSSIERYVSLSKELETLNYYIELEKLRFSDKFSFTLEIDPELDQEFIEIPSMVLQPYIENAIIHGLSNKKEAGKLSLNISQRENYLVCKIEDNGIGRKASGILQQNYNPSHKSVGTSVTEERLKVINKTDNVDVEIIDMMQQDTPQGTKVIMKIELNTDDRSY